MTAIAQLAAYDVVVVGAGPAGLAAAETTAGAGLATLVVDENPDVGGQIYRAVRSSPVTDPRVLGLDYWSGRALAERTLASGAEVVCGTTVWSLDRSLEIGLSRQGQAQMVTARHVILATGALERPFPIPGWTLPNVMTVGAAQTLLKASGLVADGRVVLAGCGPLLWLFAAQTLRAGGKIVALLDTTPAANVARAAPYLPAFLLSPLARKGWQLVREVTAALPVIRNVTGLEAEGDGRVERVTYRRGGKAFGLDADYLFLHQGVVSNINLAASAGVAHRWDGRQLCFVPDLDEDFQCSAPGISIAGDGAGIAGAWAAADRGRVAAMAVVRRLAPGQPQAGEQAARQSLRRNMVGRGFLDALYRPAAQFRQPRGDTIVCRCEEIRADQVRQAARQGAAGPNQMKAFLRTGMGPCQGRLCGLTVTELIAAERQTSPGHVGYYRLRAPVKPITLDELASLPADPPAVKAVVR